MIYNIINLKAESAKQNERETNKLQLQIHVVVWRLKSLRMDIQYSCKEIQLSIINSPAAGTLNMC